MLCLSSYFFNGKRKALGIASRKPKKIVMEVAISNHFWRLLFASVEDISISYRIVHNYVVVVVCVRAGHLLGRAQPNIISLSAEDCCGGLYAQR